LWLWRRRRRATEEANFEVNFTLRTTGGSNEREFPDDGRVIEFRKVFEREAKGGDEGFGGIGGFGMKDLESESGVLKRKWKRESETFVPDRGSVAGIVGFGGESTVRIEPENDVGFEIAGFPVDVFEVFGGNDGEVEIY
jgi:hypothetical protein